MFCGTSSQVQVAEVCIEVIALLFGSGAGEILQDQRDVVCAEVERDMAILEVICLIGAIVEIKQAILYFDSAGLQVKKGVNGMRGGILFGPRLVGCSIGVGDQVYLGLRDLKVAEKKTRAPEVEDAEAGVHRVYLSKGSFALGFAPVKDYSAGIKFEFGEFPMETADFRTSAGSGFDAGDEALSDDVFEA